MYVDIIIPVYNQKYPLKLTLDGFSKQRTNSNMHIIVVDDGSTDDLCDVVNQYSHLDITFIKQENRGRAAARNKAVQFLKGVYIIFNDCDRVPCPDFVDFHLHQLINNKNAVCIGVPKEIFFRDPLKEEKRIQNTVQTNGRLAREPVYSKIIDVLFDEYGMSRSGIPWIATFSGNMSLHKDTFLLSKGFDESFVNWGFEHFEYGYRLFLMGKSFLRERRCINYHIAHPRPNNFYTYHINESHQFFYNKHSTKEVQLLKPFMQGEISLQDYEQAVNGESDWLKLGYKPLMNNIFS